VTCNLSVAIVTKLALQILFNRCIPDAKHLASGIWLARYLASGVSSRNDQRVQVRPFIIADAAFPLLATMTKGFLGILNVECKSMPATMHTSVLREMLRMHLAAQGEVPGAAQLPDAES